MRNLRICCVLKTTKYGRNSQNLCFRRRLLHVLCSTAVNRLSLIRSVNVLVLFRLEAVALSRNFQRCEHLKGSLSRHRHLLPTLPWMLSTANNSELLMLRQPSNSTVFSVSTQTFILNFHIRVEHVSSKGSGSDLIPGLKYGSFLMCWTASNRFKSLKYGKI